MKIVQSKIEAWAEELVDEVNQSWGCAPQEFLVEIYNLSQMMRETIKKIDGMMLGYSKDEVEDDDIDTMDEEEVILVPYGMF